MLQFSKKNRFQLVVMLLIILGMRLYAWVAWYGHDILGANLCGAYPRDADLSNLAIEMDAQHYRGVEPDYVIVNRIVRGSPCPSK